MDRPERDSRCFAVSQSVPGAIAVNSATFLGYRIAGIPGAMAAALGMVIPTFLIIIVFGVLLVSVQHNAYVQVALKGIRPVVVAMIAVVAFKMAKVSLVDKACWVVFILRAFVLTAFKSINIVLIIISGAAAGILIINFRNTLCKLQRGENMRDGERKDKGE